MPSDSCLWSANSSASLKISVLNTSLFSLPSLIQRPSSTSTTINQNNILILYSNSVSNHINKAIRVTKSKNGILITDDSKASKSNITTVRCRTFKKAFDLNNDTRNKPSSSFKRRSKENSNNYKNQAIEENNTQNDTINELIDLVD